MPSSIGNVYIRNDNRKQIAGFLLLNEKFSWTKNHFSFEHWYSSIEHWSTNSLLFLFGHNWYASLIRGDRVIATNHSFARRNKSTWLLPTGRQGTYSDNMNLSMKRKSEQPIDNQNFPQTEENIQVIQIESYWTKKSLSFCFKDPFSADDEERSFFVEQSPFEEVAANVSNHDDPTMSCFTFRSCLLGISFTCVLAFINQFFAFRTLPMSIEPLLVQLLAYPFGKSLAVILPTRRFNPFGTRYSFSLNPGPFTIKEHCLITSMANTASVRVCT